ncbi:unnamed protein product [Cylindrotheca closterium]|uniref:Uncharacterized protein n=1 Tax=Cylindrotheca closterium TaxID=2856 RepID=A0AAD2PXQ8_9STRA|nr:unnamed protein product [Cylindrotheca closterium]
MKWKNNATGDYWKKHFEKLSSRPVLKNMNVHSKSSGKLVCKVVYEGDKNDSSSSGEQVEKDVVMANIPLSIMVLLLTQFNNCEFENSCKHCSRRSLANPKQTSNTCELFMFHWGVDDAESDNVVDDRWLRSPMLSSAALQGLFTVGAIAIDCLKQQGLLNGTIGEYEFIPGYERTTVVDIHGELHHQPDADLPVYFFCLPLCVEGAMVRAYHRPSRTQSYVHIPFGKFALFPNGTLALSTGYGNLGNSRIVGLLLPKSNQTLPMYIPITDATPSSSKEDPRRAWQKNVKRMEKNYATKVNGLSFSAKQISSAAFQTSSSIAHVLEHLLSPPSALQSSASLEDLTNVRIPSRKESGVEILAHVATPSNWVELLLQRSEHKSNKDLKVVIMIHEFFGLTDSIVDKANGLAKNGRSAPGRPTTATSVSTMHQIPEEIL